jgi:tRNA(Ile)-lysidine synthase
MDAANTAASLLQNASLVMARPLLQASRKQLESYVASTTSATSTTNPTTTRATPATRCATRDAGAGAAFPGFQERFARSAQHAQSATRLLTELAEQDLAATLDGDCSTSANCAP